MGKAIFVLAENGFLCMREESTSEGHLPVGSAGDEGGRGMEKGGALEKSLKGWVGRKVGKQEQDRSQLTPPQHCQY